MASIQQRILSGGKSEFRKEEIGLGEFFFGKSQEYGEKILQVDASSNQVETYTTINKKAIRLALHLKRWSIDSEHIVGLCLNNRMDSIIPLLATLYLGAKICSLAPTQSKQTHCAKLLEEASCDLQERPVIIVIETSEDYIQFDDLQKKISGEEDFQPKRCENCHDTGMIFFSSGSTGLSKAVNLSHYAMLNGTKNFACRKYPESKFEVGFVNYKYGLNNNPFNE